MLSCPKCGTALELALHHVEEPPVSISYRAQIVPAPRPTTTVEFILAGNPYSLSRENIYNAARELFPSTIVKYYIILPDTESHERRFPIKQVVRDALQARYGEKFIEENFTAHRARDILRRLGFDVQDR